MVCDKETLDAFDRLAVTIYQIGSKMISGKEIDVYRDSQREREQTYLEARVAIRKEPMIESRQ